MTARRPWLRSLRVRFALAMGISGLVLAVALTAYLASSLERDRYQLAEHTLKLVSQRVAGRLANDLSARKREIEVIGSLLGAARLQDRAAIAALLDALKEQQPSYAWIGLTDAHGMVLVASQHLLENQDVSSRPWFDGAIRGPYFGDPHDARLLGSKLGGYPGSEPLRFVDVAIPIRGSDGSISGVLAAHLYWRWVQDVVSTTLRQTDSPPGLEVLIADRSGHLLLKPPGEASDQLAGLQAAQASGGRYLVSQARPEEGDLSTALGWTVLAREDMAQVLAPIHAARNLMLLVSLGGCALFVLLSWYLAGRITSPLSLLARDARDYWPGGAKPFHSAVSQRADEVGALGRVITDLVHKLRLHAGRERLFIEHAPAPLAILDADLRYVVASQSWLLAYGLEGQALTGRSHYEVFPDLPEHWRNIHRRALAGEILRSDGERFDRADGSVLWLRWEVRPWHTPDGEIGGIVVFSEDISERIEAEQALKDSETRFRATFEQAAVGIAHVRIDGRWLAVNRKLCEILGYPREELLRQSFQDITHLDDLESDLASADRLVRGEIDQVQLEKRYLRKDGSVVWAQLTVALVRRTDGTPAYFVSVLEDISFRKSAELALRASAQRLQLATDAAKIGIFEWDVPAGTITWSPQLEAMFGIAPEASAKTYDYTDWLRFLHPEDRDRAVAKVQQALATGLPVEYEWRVILADGSVRWIAARFQTYMDAQGRPLKMAGVNIDITGQKAMEADLRESARLLGGFNFELARQVESRTAEMRAARDEAEQANRAKSEFLAHMSHEIRTPMNAILGAAQILERAALPPEERRLADAIRSAGRGLLALIDDVLDIAKIESGRFELDRSAFELSAVMQGLVDIFAATAQNKGIALRLLPLPIGLGALIGDSHRLGQVLHNLVANAIRFTAAGEVTVSVGLADRREGTVSLRFVVRDSGIGIAPDRLPHLFQAFVQAEASTSRRFGGTGLGLAICHQLVRLMGGEIGVSSVPAQGSEFWFELPFQQSAEPARQARLVTQAPTGPRLSGLRLLAVDDSPINLELVSRMLALEGARCDTVTDGAAALARLCLPGVVYDGVLMDVQMPGMDGLAATRALRELPDLQELPVIGLTAGALPSQREQALAAGMSDVLTKPFELDALVMTVLRQAALHPPASTR